MNRKFRGIDWTLSEYDATLRYLHFHATVYFPTDHTITWHIHDTTPRLWTYMGESCVASGIATSIPRACFMCETWIEGATRGKS